MARTHGKILSTIWADKDWTALSAQAQRVFVIALSQPRLSLAGVVDLMPERWARFAADTSADEVLEAVDDLEAAGFVVVDRATDELLIRRFVAHDIGVGANQNTLKGLWSAWSVILSDELKRAVIENMGEAIWADAEIHAPDEARELHETAVSAPREQSSERPIERPSEQSSQQAIDLPEPYPEPETAQTTESFAADFDEAWRLYPNKKERKSALKAYQARRRAGVGAPELLEATKRYAEQTKQTEKRFIKHGSTFYGPDDPWRDLLELEPEPDRNSTEYWNMTS